MNRATRVLLMSGVAVAAGLTFSAPAMAATATGASAAAPAAVSAPVTSRHAWSEGRFRSFGSCASEGRRGVWRGDWDHFRCVPVGHGRFELIVSEDYNGWHHDGWHHNGWQHDGWQHDGWHHNDWNGDDNNWDNN